jgi:hypothetical protein
VKLLLPPATYDELHHASREPSANGAVESVMRRLLGEAYEAFVSMLRVGVRVEVVVVPDLDAAYLVDEQVKL